MVLRRVPPRALRQADREHVHHAGRRRPSRPASSNAPPNPGQLRSGHLGREDGQPDCPLTWQVSPRNKFAAYIDRAMRLRGHAMNALTDPATASVVWHTPTFATGSAKWTSTVSLELLVEGGVLVQPRALRQPLSGRHLDRARHRRWYPTPARATTAPATCGTPSAQLGNYPDSYNLHGLHVLHDRLAQPQGWVPGHLGTVRRWNKANADCIRSTTAASRRRSRC